MVLRSCRAIKCLLAPRARLSGIRPRCRTYANIGLDLALIRRAQRLSSQFTKLSKQAAEDLDFTDETAVRSKRLAELQPVHDTYQQWNNAVQVRRSNAHRSRLISIIRISRNSRRSSHLRKMWN